MVLNNQLSHPSSPSSLNPLKPTSTTSSFKTIVNNLHNKDEVVEQRDDISCNKCKEQSLVIHNNINNSSRNTLKHINCSNSNANKLINSSSSSSSKGCVNLAFVDSVTECAAWYQPHMARDLAVRIVSACPVGAFIVRRSVTHGERGALALTVRVPRSFNGTGILHYLVVVNEAGYRIKGLAKVFPSLSALVVHHSVMKESLPCRLVVEEPASSEASATASLSSDDDAMSSRDGDFADLDSDPEFPCIISRLREQYAQ